MRVMTEGPTRITKGTIEAAWRKRATGERLVIRDNECRGLALIVNATSMTWTYAYHPRGRDCVTDKRWPNRTVTFGNPATHSPEDARGEANRIKGQAAAGTDPAAEKRARAERERRQRGATLGRLAEDYGRALPRRPKMRGTGLPSPRYVALELALVRLALQTMDAESVPATELNGADVRRLLSAAGEDGARNMRGKFGALSRFLDWCQDAGHIQANPCVLIARARRPKAPQARAHYLTMDELGLLWRAAEDLREPVWRDLTRFLIAMPCRRGEAARLDWSHVDLDGQEWRQPSHMTKNRAPHRLYLHVLALDVLHARHSATGGKGLGPVDGFNQHQPAGETDDG